MRFRTVALLTLVLLWACVFHEEKEVEGFTILATEEYLHARVLFDGQEIGQLDRMMFYGSLYQKLHTKIYGDSPINHLVACRVETTDLEPGEYTIEVSKTGYPTAETTVVVPTHGFHIYQLEGKTLRRSSTSS